MANKKHEFKLGELDGRKVAVRGRQVVYKAEAEKLIARLDEAVVKRTAETATLRQDVALSGLSDLGKRVLGNIADNFDRRNGPAAEISASLSAIVADLDDAPTE